MIRCREVKETSIVRVDQQNATVVEEQLKTIVTANNQLVDGTRNLTLRKCYIPFNNAQAYYQTYMESIKQQILFMKSYAACYKGFDKLNVQDRAKVFMETRFHLITGEGLIHQNDFTIACSSSVYFLDFINHFQWLYEPEKIIERSRQLWRFVQSLNFTKYETSFYLAFLFFSTFEKPDVLSLLSTEGAKQMKEIIHELKTSYQAYIIKRFNGEKLCRQRIELMQQAVHLTIEESELRVKTAKRLILPRLKSDSNGVLYYNVINSKVSE